LTLDHKRIGLMYLVGVMSAFFWRVFGVGPANRVDDANQWFLTNQQYNQVFTLHGAIMVFLFIIPSVPAALGNFLVPVMLGPRTWPFPR
jgi:cytochrome c oxidase subunit I